MALPLYDPNLHNIGLGGYGWMVRSYMKRGQEQPIEKVRVGTGDLVGNERASYWTQDDFSGGTYQYEWSDPAMFAYCDGMLPNPLSRSLRTTPDVVKVASAADLLNTSTLHFNNVPIMGFTYGDACFFCFYNGVLRIGTSGSLNFHWDPTSSFLCFWVDRESNRLYCGRTNGDVKVLSTAASLAEIHVFRPRADTGAWIKGACNSIGMFGDKLMAAFGRTLYVLKENESLRESGSEAEVGSSGTGGGWEPGSPGSRSIRTGSTDEPSAGILPAKPIQMLPFNGAMYMLCGNASREGFIATTTGQDVVTLAEIPYAVTPRCITQYAGRLYIGCSGYDMDANEHYGELYELSGNSLRLVRTFKRESTTGRQRVQTLRWMDVHEGLLWFPGAGGYNLDCYDATSDAFFSGPSLPAYARVALTKPVMTLGFRSQLYAWIDSPDPDLRGVWRTRQTPSDYPGGTEYSLMHTSDFGPEPARTKVWSEFVVETRFQGAGGCQASIDGGATWISLTDYTATQNGNIWLTRFRLAGAVPPSTRIRLGYSIAQPGYGLDAELLSTTLGFVFGDNGKHGWQLTLGLITGHELEDGSMPAVEVGSQEQLAQLWSWADNRTVLNFIDRNGGTTHDVILTQCVEAEPQVNDKTYRECFYSTYLVEV